MSKGVAMKLIHGDCLKEHEQIESGSVDLILTDLPYGTMNGAALDGWKDNKTNWDFAIDPIKVFEIANRILRKNGKMVLFSQEPYTSQLITNAIPNVPFSYRMMWEKDHYANALLCKKAPVSYFEDILVFSKTEGFVKGRPFKDYILKVREFINKPNKEIFEDFEKAGFKKYAVLDIFNSKKARRNRFICKNTYNNLIELYHIDNMQDFKPYPELKAIDDKFKQQYASTFNLWQGGKYKSNILKYKKDYDGYHPTQKPVMLLEDLIKTFSNEGNLVVDLTMGSGSTGVACVNTNRDFIGIEKDEGYFTIAEKRIKEAQYQGRLF
jgi:site-specific DNA-methyltransferase (adenine-specific)